MSSELSHLQVATFLFSLALLLGAARLLGEVAKHLRQPALLGELLAGILLGPSLFGHIAPELSQSIFPLEGAVALARNSFALVAVILFLLVAGMEVDLSLAWRSGKTSIYVSVMGIVFPFLIGFSLAWVAPGLLHITPEVNIKVFALFFATALCISALPVISKILMDLNLFKTDIGMIVISAAIVDDLVGWFLFALVLSLMGTATEGHFSIQTTVIATISFVVFMLTAGRWMIHRSLPWLQAWLSWPGGVMGFALTAAFFCAALTEYIGVHGIFGAFIFGIALGDSRHLRERTRVTLDQFISFIFAPLFFANIGLKVDFVANFDLVLVVVVLLVATICKVVGCGFGAMLGGLPRRHAFAVGFGMNARGAMEIILGMLALQAGVIGESLFVALVVMALVTSMISGTFMERLLQRKARLNFLDVVGPKAFVPALRSTEREGAIGELAEALCRGGGLDPKAVAAAAWEREGLMATGLENGVAIPHARMEGARAPMIAVGISREGIDFDAADGQRARLVFLIVTPKNDDNAQLEILAGIAGMVGNPVIVQEALESRNHTELMAVLRAREARG